MDSKVFSEPSFTYDPVKDLAPVDQFGFIDLRDAYINQSIPGNLSSSTEDYNGVEDPASLIGRPSDVFDAFRKAEYVKSAESAVAAQAAKASSAGDE